MKRFLRNLAPLMLIFIIPFQGTFGQAGEYPTSDEINNQLKDLQTSNPEIASIKSLGESPGGKEILLLELGNEVSKEEKKSPAILVVANLEGAYPVSSLGAIRLAELIIEGEHYKKNTWYIVANGNPDALGAFFNKPYYERHRNSLSVNDDLDHLSDEDGYEDLNEDGYITNMRVKHPDGEWLIVSDEPRLMRKADKKKGETGIYKIYKEGLNKDDDGEYNEDPPGGTNVNRNFPHLFNPKDKQNGLYPGSSPEARAIIEFAYEHPEIAMSFSLGATNFIYMPPRGGRKGEVDMDKIKIPERFAGMLNADPDKYYSMSEIIEMVQPMVPAGMEVDESMVASFLGLGGVVNPLEPDLVFYNKFSEDYKEYIEEKAGSFERFDPDRAQDGSFELWSYYHLGVPVFSMDLWSVPKPSKEEKDENGLSIDKLEKMSSEEFLEIEEEELEAFLRDAGVPDQFNAKGVMEMVKAGRMTPERIAGMMKQMPSKDKEEGGADPREKALLAYSDESLKGRGFVEWETVDHPEFGEVEIGGFIPFLESTPERSVADSVINLKLPFIFEIVKELPSLSIYETRVKPKGAGVYELDVWIENTSYIPFPTAMGKRNKQPAPAVIMLSGEDVSFLSGKERTAIQDVSGNSRKKLSWMIKAEGKTDLVIDLQSKSAGGDQKTIKIGG